MLKIKKIFIILFIVALLILIGIGIWIGVEMVGGTHGSVNPSGASEYSAVYMTNGDVYFGKIHSFPKPYISDALYLVRNTNTTGQTQIGLATFSSVFWAPAGSIYFNPDQVLFTAPLRNDSQIINVIKNPSLLNQSTQQQGATGQITPSTNGNSVSTPSNASTTKK